jgi:heptosyltransferase I
VSESKKNSDERGRYSRVLIVRLGAMGDVLHAVPAVAALRVAMPEAKFGWVMEERWAEMLCGAGDEVLATVEGRPLVDVVHKVNTKAWRTAMFSDETWAEASGASRELREVRYEAAVDLQGAMKSAVIAQWSGASSRFGFASPRERLAGMFYTRAVETRAAHVVEQNLELASAVVGKRLGAAEFELARDGAAETWCEKFLASVGRGRFAILNPGAGWGAKCWPAERYAEVARELSALGMMSLLNYGPNEEELVTCVEELSGGTAKKVLCSIAELVSLTRRASLSVGGDTGPMHLAAALKVPVIALFGPTDPKRNGPYGTSSVVLRSAESATSYKHVAQGDEGLQAIAASEVVKAARSLLGS